MIKLQRQEGDEEGKVFVVFSEKLFDTNSMIDVAGGFCEMTCLPLILSATPHCLAGNLVIVQCYPSRQFVKYPVSVLCRVWLGTIFI